MKLKLLGLVALATVFLVGCEDSEERNTLIEKGLMFNKEPLEFVGYLDVESRLYSSSTIRYEVLKDPVTSCHYLFEGYRETISPYIGIDGAVYGCKDKTNKIDGNKVYSKEDYLKVLSEYYPDTEGNELEYMLETVFNYGSITFDEFKDKVEYLNKTDEPENIIEENIKNVKDNDKEENHKNDKEKNNNDEE